MQPIPCALIPFLVLTVGCDEGTANAHVHHDTPHIGVPGTFAYGDSRCHLELKLHDDKGDLELWLAHDDKFATPFDLPISATVEVEFVDRGGRKVTLRPRNTARNEDEDGKTNVRDGKTNYFIFPGQSGEDASWLQGRDFKSEVIVRLRRDGVRCASEQLLLTPHVH